MENSIMSRCALNKNADLLIKIGLIVTEPNKKHWFWGTSNKKKFSLEMWMKYKDDEMCLHLTELWKILSTIASWHVILLL